MLATMELLDLMDLIDGVDGVDGLVETIFKTATKLQFTENNH